MTQPPIFSPAPEPSCKSVETRNNIDANRQRLKPQHHRLRVQLNRQTLLVRPFRLNPPALMLPSHPLLLLHPLRSHQSYPRSTRGSPAVRFQRSFQSHRVPPRFQSRRPTQEKQAGHLRKSFRPHRAQLKFRLLPPNQESQAVPFRKSFRSLRARSKCLLLLRSPCHLVNPNRLQRTLPLSNPLHR